MKRSIAAIILLLFLIFAYTFNYTYINKTCEKANEKLQNCIEVYKNGEDATEEARELERYWTDKEPFLSVFANHAMIDEIELAISSLAIYTDTKNNAIFYEYSSTVKTLLHQMLEDTRPSMHSIL